jgi:hypothetical protein
MRSVIFLDYVISGGTDDGACSGAGDYVDDTPNQGNSSDGCPSHPQIGCNVKTMFQNYMDYTNDVCMNLYTKQQVERCSRSSKTVHDGPAYLRPRVFMIQPW